ncbi:MAG TPA: SdrD B-like domain-containing protein [Pyrinomonadaceae bacterium]
MSHARLQRIVCIVAALLVLTTICGRVHADETDRTLAGTVISNRAEATYYDASGAGFSTVSPTIQVTVLSVSALAVTPDETTPSNTVAPNERVERLFRICNAGNTPDLYTITRADASAPAAIAALYFDTDASGTFTEGDRQATVGAGMSPRVARGACLGLVALVDTNGMATGSLLTISVTARSNVSDAVGGASEDDGTIINTVGSGARISAPNDPRLPPTKFVENSAHVVAAYGQTLNYIIAFRNSGDVTARRVVLIDELPDGLEYIAGSLRLGARSLTDGNDGDEGSVVGQRVEVRVGEVKVDELVQVELRARVRVGVAPGVGLVNHADVTADNAAPTTTTNAIAVVNPFGLVYEARGGGGATIGGARVALLRDSTNGVPLQLPREGGSVPNERNENPFVTDGQGRWNFVLAPDQTGTASVAARYFLNVTANGYRSRMLEISITPTASRVVNGASLYSVTVRAIDGQPIAQNGSFELTEESVTIENLAAFALNVPMFEATAVEVTKSADRSSVEIGDVVTYRVEVHNTTAARIENATVRDRLPESFHYAEGTARVENLPAPPRSIEPEIKGGELVFNVGQIAAGARVTLIYRVRVGANAREGEQFNTAVLSGVFLSGETVRTTPARASVRVRRGVFSMQQLIVGRVFEDTNGNGQFDEGEKPVAGVRLYLNNGQSVTTDSAGQYNFPSVNDGSMVIALDPITLPDGYALANTNRRDGQSWTRLLRTPLGGGALLRQNFALRAPANNNSDAANTNGDGATRPSAKMNLAQSQSQRATSINSRTDTNDKRSTTKKISNDADGTRTNANSISVDANGASDAAKRQPSNDGALASGTYEVASTERIEPVAPGAVLIVSPAQNDVVAGAALEVEARVAEGWSVALDVEGTRIADSKIAIRRVDRANKITTYTFVGINLRPGPNRIKATAVSPEGASRETTELTAFGRGPARRLEVAADKSQLSAGGRDSTRLRVRAFDEWGNPAADGAVALEVSAGRLVGNDEDGEPKTSDELDGAATARNQTNGMAGESVGSGASQQVVALKNGAGEITLVADNKTGAADVRATTGTIEARTKVQITPEIRPSILVGLAQLSVGSAAPEMSLRETDGNTSSRIAFFYRGSFFGNNLLTLAYDSQRPLNRQGGRDRLFQLDPLERAYPIFGDSSTRYEDAQSNSKLYARLDRGRSFLLFGDFETEHRDLALAGYSRKLTGVKAHIENSRGDYVSVTGARPDTAFARDVFAGGGLGVARLTYTEILPGSEQVVIEVRDRRNPEIILSRESLIRSIDYNLDPNIGEIFFLRPISSFDYALNLVQVVVTYEHRAGDMSSAVYTGRAVKNFEGAGLRLGVSVVDQKQADYGSFVLGGVDAEKRLPRGGTVQFEYAMSRGQVGFTGNLFGAEGNNNAQHNGSAYRVELNQPLGYKDGTVRASFARAGANFLNPFGATVTPGSQRAHVGVDLKMRRSSLFSFGVTDERNHTANVNNRRLTGSFNWMETWSDRVRTTVGYDMRRYSDDISGNDTNSNLITAGVEWQATDKLQLSVRREQNLGEADPTYPNQTTLAANYQWNQWARLFFTQRLAAAPIVPISDAGATGFAASGARRETAIGIETRLGRYTNLVSRYQLENGINGSDSFAIIGLQNRLPVRSNLSLELGYERGFHLAGAGESFNAATLGFSWQPTDNFRTNGRYELRDRLGLAHTMTFAAAGRLADNLTALARVQMSSASFNERDNSSFNATASLAWRPLHTDRFGWLFTYTRRDLFHDGAGLDGHGSTRDRSDTLSTDAYMQATRELELYARFALKFGQSATPDLASVSSLTYLMQGRAVYRLGQYVDAAGEVRMLVQPSSLTRRTSYGAELGFWVMPDLRVGGGYNFTGASEPTGSLVNSGRRGFYFTISSKLSNLFDLFGTSSPATADGTSNGGATGQSEAQKSTQATPQN